MKMINIYKNCLSKYPYLTRMFTSGLILSTADFTYQTFFEKRETYDFKRIGINYTVGFIAAPWLFVWFNKIQPQTLKFLLGKPLNTPIYDKVTKKISYDRLIAKMLLDYFICFPVMQLIYHVNFNILYNNNLESIYNAFETKVSFSLQNYHQAWPVASCLIHLFVPAYLKAICANISGTTWNNYVNYLFSSK
ncbi:hypothetical protein ABPG74_005645 [Tetrahymena malaccensis]